MDYTTYFPIIVIAVLLAIWLGSKDYTVRPGRQIDGFLPFPSLLIPHTSSVFWMMFTIWESIVFCVDKLTRNLQKVIYYMLLIKRFLYLSWSEKTLNPEDESYLSNLLSTINLLIASSVHVDLGLIELNLYHLSFFRWS